jgi:hypothetical protein
VLQTGPPCRFGRFHEFSAGRRGGLRLGLREVYGPTAQVARLSGRSPDRCPRRRRGGARRAARPLQLRTRCPEPPRSDQTQRVFAARPLSVAVAGGEVVATLEQPTLRPAATGCNRWAPQRLRDFVARSDYEPARPKRYGGEPSSIQVRKRSTSSAAQRPSQGMLPSASFS